MDISEIVTIWFVVVAYSFVLAFMAWRRRSISMSQLADEEKPRRRISDGTLDLFPDAPASAAVPASPINLVRLSDASRSNYSYSTKHLSTMQYYQAETEAIKPAATARLSKPPPIFQF
ncbi:hypothetical protein H0H92_013424 [Tricholoma furcatifolium]|nr:hypothetical protein H0H92_013424 [Tricholoma furcatifolium]